MREEDLRQVVYWKSMMQADGESQMGWRPIFDQNKSKIRKNFPQPNHFFTHISNNVLSKLGHKHRINFTQHHQEKDIPFGFYLANGFVLFLLGSSSNYFGSNKQVNLWLNPFMAYLGWNVFIYLLLLVGSFFPKGKKPWDPFTLLCLRGIQKVQDTFRSLVGKSQKMAFNALLAKIQFTFRKNWFDYFPQLVRLQLAKFFHSMAICLTLGVIAGMYLRGFAENYQFSWNSTLITPDLRPKLLEFLFGPVLSLARSVFPQGLPALEANNGAAWIHLFALSSLLYIAIPRLLLTFIATYQLRQRKRHLALSWQDSDWQQLYAQSNLAPTTLNLLFYSYTPSEDQIHSLLRSLKKNLPGQYQKGKEYSLDWGETEWMVPEASSQQLYAIVFNGSQTPEDEVHGIFSKNLLLQIKNSEPQHQLLVTYDMQRVPDSSLDSRTQLWQTLLEQHGITHSFPVNLKHPQLDSELETIQQALFRNTL